MHCKVHARVCKQTKNFFISEFLQFLHESVRVLFYKCKPISKMSGYLDWLVLIAALLGIWNGMKFNLFFGWLTFLGSLWSYITKTLYLQFWLSNTQQHSFYKLHDMDFFVVGRSNSRTGIKLWVMHTIFFSSKTILNWTLPTQFTPFQQ